MPVKANEISAILKQQIKTYGKKIKTDEVGEILTIGDGIAQVSGLDNAMLGELLAFPNDVYGMALNLEEDYVGAVLMGLSLNIKEGDQVRRTKRVTSVPVGDVMIGRVLNGLGQAIDGKAEPKTNKYREIFRVAPGVMSRVSVSEPLETGIIAIDSMIPIGKGQRELIIGDRQTGKTAVAVDAIINQKGKDVLCVYVAIGQKNSTIAQIVEKLKKAGAMDFTTIISASASDPAPLQYVAPYTGVTIAEEWMESGRNVLIVYDDLSKHAVAYRTLALLLRRAPGREAYPGDVFYLHSQLLERAARVNAEYGGGSITALPIIETQAGDISAYIPTNVISITDGQIFMMTDLFNAGQRPAIDAGYSVSRVGSSAQIKAMKQATGSLRTDLAQYNEMAAFAQFGSDLDESTRFILNHGKKVLELIKQPQYSPYSQIDQAILLLAANAKLTNPIPVASIATYKNELIEFFRKDPFAHGLWKVLDEKKEFDEALRSNILYAVAEFIKKFVLTIPNYAEKDNDKMPEVPRPTLTVSSEDEVRVAAKAPATEPKRKAAKAPVQVIKTKKASAKPAAKAAPKKAPAKTVAKKPAAKKAVKK